MSSGPLTSTVIDLVKSLVRRPMGTFSDVRDRLLLDMADYEKDMASGRSAWETAGLPLSATLKLDASARDLMVALRSGAVFNFGVLENDVIKDTSHRAYPLLNKGYLPAPFPVWVGAHEFPMQVEEHGVFHPIWCVYVIRHGEDGTFTATELWMRGRGRDCLYAIAGHLTVQPAGERWWGEGIAGLPNDTLPDYGGIQDAVLTMLMLLNTRGLPVTHHSPAPKLNAARVRSGKPPLPSHWSVDTSIYTTAMRETDRRPAPRAGTPAGSHASPVPHLRRAHMRNMTNGVTVPVRECVVGLRSNGEVDDNANPFARSHYEVRR
jgi:hypothetical protein